jgi:hypothetical protein
MANVRPVLSGASNDSGEVGWHHGPFGVHACIFAALVTNSGRFRGSAENKSRGLEVKARHARYAVVLASGPGSSRRQGARVELGSDSIFQEWLSGQPWRRPNLMLAADPPPVRGSLRFVALLTDGGAWCSVLRCPAVG